MPGKINPILPELMKQVYFQIAGNDTAVTIAAEEGEEPAETSGLIRKIRERMAAKQGK